MLAKLCYNILIIILIFETEGHHHIIIFVHKIRFSQLVENQTSVQMHTFHQAFKQIILTNLLIIVHIYEFECSLWYCESCYYLYFIISLNIIYYYIFINPLLYSFIIFILLFTIIFYLYFINYQVYIFSLINLIYSFI